MNSPHKTEVLDARSTPLESYVVRIYRRDSHDHARFAGTVEIVASGSELRFNGLRELQRILANRKAVNPLGTPIKPHTTLQGEIS